MKTVEERIATLENEVQELPQKVIEQIIKQISSVQFSPIVNANIELEVIESD